MKQIAIDITLNIHITLWQSDKKKGLWRNREIQTKIPLILLIR